MKTFCDSYLESTSPAITKVVQDASRQLVRQKYKLATSSTETLQEAKKVTKLHVEAIESSIEELLVRPSREEKDYAQLVSALVMLFQTNASEAQKFIGPLEQIFESQFAPTRASNLFDSLRKTMSNLDQSFPVTNVDCRKTRKAFDLHANELPSFLFVVNSESLDSIKR